MVAFFVLVLLFYIALSGNYQLDNWVLGIVVGIGIVFLIRPGKSAANLQRLPVFLYSFFRYTLVTLIDLVISGFQVAWLAFLPNPVFKQGIIAVPSYLKSSFGIALTAHWITITPGESVIEIGDGVLYTHFLDISDYKDFIDGAEQIQRGLISNLLLELERYDV